MVFSEPKSWISIGQAPEPVPQQPQCLRMAADNRHYFYLVNHHWPPDGGGGKGIRCYPMYIKRGGIRAWLTAIGPDGLLKTSMQGDSIHLPSMARVDRIQTIALVTNQGL